MPTWRCPDITRKEQRDLDLIRDVWEGRGIHKMLEDWKKFSSGLTVDQKALSIPASGNKGAK
jgi:hypothetical protein